MGLVSLGVTHVAMEATGSYSMPVYHALLEHGDEPARDRLEVMRQHRWVQTKAAESELAPVEQRNGVALGNVGAQSNTQHRAAVRLFPVGHATELHLVVGVLVRAGVQGRQEHFAALPVAQLQPRRVLSPREISPPFPSRKRCAAPAACR